MLAAPCGIPVNRLRDPRQATGGVVVGLISQSTKRDGDATCAVASESVFDGIQEDPSEYYVNGHNMDFPNGAIRGQLHAFS